MTVESQIAEFIARYTPQIAGDIVACRMHLRALFPRGYELVFDNYNALVFGIAPSEKSGDSFISIAAYPRWVTLFFLYGATLADPQELLEGAGTQVRGIRLAAPADFDKPAVRALIAQACAPVAEALALAPPLHTVIKTVAAKQRARRPA
jgi:hypothetical protein